MNCDYIRTKITADTIGAEYAGTLKNIYAIAVGIAHGLEYGDNLYKCVDEQFDSRTQMLSQACSFNQA